MRRIGENESFLDFYNNEKAKSSPRIIASILNAVYTTQYNQKDIELDVEKFGCEFKKENETLFLELQDLPIFKLYNKMIQKKSNG